MHPRDPDPRRAGSANASFALARMAAVSELALGVAHALNNALTSIGGEASFLQDETKDPGVDQACALILEQVQRCGRLTHALLQRRSGPALEAGECELGRVARDLAFLLREALPRRIELALETADEPILLAMDLGRMETILLLLVQCAAFHLPNGGHVRIRTREGVSRERALLEVSWTQRSPTATCGASEGPRLELHRQLLDDLLEAQGASRAVEASPTDGLLVHLPRLLQGGALRGSSPTGA